MKPMEAYSKKWHDYLKVNKLMGMKCNRCGAYEFPPVPVCNTCSSTDVNWAEVSGDGELVTISRIGLVDPLFEKYGPTIVAFVKLDEGFTFVSWLISDDGQEIEDLERIKNRIPCRAKMVPQDRGTYSYPVFRMVD